MTTFPKYNAEDTSLTISNSADEKRILPLPGGTHITINVVGLHYNRMRPTGSIFVSDVRLLTAPAARYWKDPDEFQPGRFLEPDWPRDAFIPFSAGENIYRAT